MLYEKRKLQRSCCPLKAEDAETKPMLAGKQKT